MSQKKYRIHQLSARAVMGYSKERPDGYYSIELNSVATEKCKVSGVTEQDDNALFYQIMESCTAASRLKQTASSMTWRRSFSTLTSPESSTAPADRRNI